MRPSRNGGWIIDRSPISSALRPLVTSMMSAKIIVAAPTTAVPISTGLAVALNVLPAPSFSSRNALALSKFGLNLKSFSISSSMLGICSITDSSYTDCALSVTGPYESTAMVTGPMPRKPNATRPNANTVAAAPHANGVIAKPLSPSAPAAARFCEYRRSVSPAVDDTAYAIAIRPAITRPIQYPEQLPAVSPDRMLSDGPPSFDAATTSRTRPEVSDA